MQSLHMLKAHNHIFIRQWIHFMNKYWKVYNAYGDVEKQEFSFLVIQPNREHFKYSIFLGLETLINLEIITELFKKKKKKAKLYLGMQLPTLKKK